MFRPLFIPLGFVACMTQSYASVKPVSLFSDHMVLQQGVAVPVWGTADEGTTVTVRFAGQSVAAKTVNGRWKVSLPALSSDSKGKEMLIIGGRDTVRIHDVLVGEVWIASGQSNMERQLGPRPPQQPLYNWEKERDAADYPLIREYYVPLNYAKDKVTDVNSQWTVCSPQTVVDFSAVGYFFAKHLYEQRKTPVGIIFSAYGGTPAEDWTSQAALEGDAKLQDLVKNYTAVMSGGGWHPPKQQMSGLYNGMIHPLIPYAVKGVVWYQGESNNGRADQYQEVLTNMIRNWRHDFAQPLPFIIVQIAPHKDMKPELREAQLQVVQHVKQTALVVTTDCGDSADIHPAYKQPVGERLAIAAEGLVYGGKQEFMGPLFEKARITGHSIEVSFSHTGTGLKVAGDVLTGFEVSDASGKYYPGTAVIAGNKVRVSSDQVSQPVKVRYGWSNVPHVNLYNREGLPASPFSAL
jgi:sialate O-acetylesterase